VGHDADAVDAVGVAAATVGEGVAPGADDVVAVLVPPQAARVAAKVSAVSGIHREWLLVTWAPSIYTVEGVEELDNRTMPHLRAAARGHQTHRVRVRLLVPRRL
jgi:hypothetical protein